MAWLLTTTLNILFPPIKKREEEKDQKSCLSARSVKLIGIASRARKSNNYCNTKQKQETYAKKLFKVLSGNLILISFIAHLGSINTIVTIKIFLIINLLEWNIGGDNIT